MWRRWQLPCIALSLNNGMLICITRDVITSTVKRKHNNSSSAPPWDRLGWPTLALWRDALELWLSQTHTLTHTRAHLHTHARKHGHTVTHANFFGVQLSSLHMQSSSSAAGLRSSSTRTLLGAEKCIQMLLRCTHWHAMSPAELSWWFLF